MMEGIDDKEVETIHSILPVLRILKVTQTLTKLTPSLWKKRKEKNYFPCKPFSLVIISEYLPP